MATLAPESFARLTTDAQANYEMWDAYNFGGGVNRVQLPWEIALNGMLYRGNRRGAQTSLWPEPPGSAWTLLHPTVGIAPYSADGTSSGVVGALEIVGWTRWDYSEKNARENEWGAALAAVYLPEGKSSGWYPGAVLRTPLNGLSIVYAQVEDDDGDAGDMIALSMDISGFFSNRKGVTKQLVCSFGLAACPD